MDGVPPPARLAFHLPLAMTFLVRPSPLSSWLGAQALVGTVVRPRDAALAVAMTALAAHLTSWHLVAWGF